MVLKGPVGLMATKERYVQASEKEQETKCVMFISSSGSGPVPHFHHKKIDPFVCSFVGFQFFLEPLLYHNVTPCHLEND